jgi:hypothetical protein
MSRFARDAKVSRIVRPKPDEVGIEGFSMADDAFELIQQ